MSLSELREAVCEANVELVRAGLVTLSFGNASGVDRDEGAVVIKPSGVAYARLRPTDMVVVDLADGTIRAGAYRPSSDTPTHLAMYRRYPSISGVVHTHSSFASSWAQAGRSIPCLGTTHADHFHGPVPVTRALTADEIEGDYERETGNVIIETLEGLGLDALEMPAVLVRSHGPFTWGVGPADAVANAVALEAVAAMAHRTMSLEAAIEPISALLLERHFERKHGPAAYYGQSAEQG
jgi:L-ribulose-5-phosphate 4-epimerase